MPILNNVVPDLFETGVLLYLYHGGYSRFSNVFKDTIEILNHCLPASISFSWKFRGKHTHKKTKTSGFMVNIYTACFCSCYLYVHSSRMEETLSARFDELQSEKKNRTSSSA